MEDIGAPSFSLGLDFDSDDEDPPMEESVIKEVPNCPIDLVSSQEDDDGDRGLSNEEVEEEEGEETLCSDIHVDENPPPALKRLKRGGPPPRVQSFGVDRRELEGFSRVLDDDIEDFSSQEDLPRDKQSSGKTSCAWSNPKLPLHSQRVLTKQTTTKLKTRENTPSSNASTLTSLNANKSSSVFPKLTISPLRKFQLLDSDSDDPCAIDDPYKDANRAGTSRKSGQCDSGQSVPSNQQKKANLLASTLKPVDLWKDFTPKKSVNIQTPALDEFCDEYFKSVKDVSVAKGNEDTRFNSSKACSQKTSVNQYGDQSNPLSPAYQCAQQSNPVPPGCGNQSNPAPPAYQYFCHDDLNIRRLVRERLPHFFPLGAEDNQLHKQPDASAIDYMSQFGQRETSSQLSGKRTREIGQSSQRGRRNSKSSKAKETVQASANWMTPKSCVNNPKDAGQRRVQANNRSAGHWYTDEHGKKVYVTKTGEVLTGRIAYRHHRKDSGAGGFKKPRKRATTRKRSK